MIKHYAGIRTDLIPEHSSFRFSVPHNLDIVSFFAGDSFILKDIAKNSDINILTSNITYDRYQHRYKIKDIINCCNRSNNEYVMILDGRDVIVDGDLSVELNKFQSLNCDILYSANTKPDKILNSGCIIGKREAILKFYEYIDSLESEIFKWISLTNSITSDEVRVKYCLNKYPHKDKIMIDNSMDVFKTVNRNELF